MLWYLFAPIILYLLYKLLIVPQLYWKRKNVSQGLPIPFVGDSIWMVMNRQSLMDFALSLYSKHPNKRYHGVYQMTIPALVIRDTELLKQITVKDFDHFVDHMDIVPEDSDPILNKGLFSMKGDPWKNMRNTLSPAFTGSKMKLMFNLIRVCAEQYTKFYEEKGPEVIVLDMKNSFGRFTNDVIATCAFGLQCDSLRNPDNEFHTMGAELMDVTGFVQNSKLFLYKALPKIMKLLDIKFLSVRATTFFANIIEDAIALREEKGIVRPDMLHILLEAKKGNFGEEPGQSGDSKPGKQVAIEDIDIIAQAVVFFAGGFDTTSTLLSFLAYELAINPEVQEKLIAEVDNVREKCNGRLTYEYLTKLEYMDMVISETLRKWPPGALLDRVCTKPYTIEAKNPGEVPIHLNKGDSIFIPVAGFHYDETFHEKPEVFDPERFNSENKHKITNYNYMPFGVGPRNCIGTRFALMETKTLIYNILSSFEITVVEKTVVPVKIMGSQLGLQPVGGMWLGLKKRS